MKRKCVADDSTDDSTLLNAEAPLGLLRETHSVGRRMHHLFCKEQFKLKIILVASTVSPKVEANTYISGVNIYRQDPHTSQSQFFDLDLDLNPDLWFLRHDFFSHKRISFPLFSEIKGPR